jgi:hypothetical protein
MTNPKQLHVSAANRAVYSLTLWTLYVCWRISRCLLNARLDGPKDSLDTVEDKKPLLLARIWHGFLLRPNHIVVIIPTEPSLVTEWPVSCIWCKRTVLVFVWREWGCWVNWRDLCKVIWFWSEVKWVTVKFLGTKVPCTSTLGWPFYHIFFNILLVLFCIIVHMVVCFVCFCLIL